MTALTLAIDNPASTRRINRIPALDNGAEARNPHHHGVIRQAGDDGDFVLAMLSQARQLLERLANRRRATNVARNRVETRRQLAKLPTQVRDDLLHAERKVIVAPDTSD